MLNDKEVKNIKFCILFTYVKLMEREQTKKINNKLKELDELLILIDRKF